MKIYKDITWCTQDCEDRECFKNKKHIPANIFRDDDYYIKSADYNDCKHRIKPEEKPEKIYKQETLF